VDVRSRGRVGHAGRGKRGGSFEDASEESRSANQKCQGAGKNILKKGGEEKIQLTPFVERAHKKTWAAHGGSIKCGN